MMTVLTLTAVADTIEDVLVVIGIVIGSTNWIVLSGRRSWAVIDAGCYAEIERFRTRYFLWSFF